MVEGPVGWEAGGEYPNADLDGGKLRGIDVSP